MDKGLFEATKRAAFLKERLKSFKLSEGKKEFTYLLTQRPPSIGTHPNGQIKDFEEIMLGNRKAYRVTYSTPLTAEEIRKFELTEEMTMDDVGRSFKEGGAVHVIENVSGESIDVTTFFGGKSSNDSFSQRGFTNKIVNKSKEIELSKKPKAVNDSSNIDDIQEVVGSLASNT
jgi:hypothetical protein